MGITEIQKKINIPSSKENIIVSIGCMLQFLIGPNCLGIIHVLNCVHHLFWPSLMVSI
jgi:hypothetical protein